MPDRVRKDLLLKVAIVKSGKTQREVAAACGLTENDLSRIVRGATTPRVDVASRIARELDTNVESLWPAPAESEPASEQVAA